MISYRKALGQLLAMNIDYHVASKRFGSLITIYNASTRRYFVFDLRNLRIVNAPSTDRRECEILCRTYFQHGTDATESMVGFRTYPIGIYY